ncbi:hypothetical protein [Pedobacter sp. KLB.chiD]|uniref:hypothetical protein n=1 Tax=Pedobacter sp. KLB.chiD TaxID=3387402 RepID=UPI00399A25D5
MKKKTLLIIIYIVTQNTLWAQMKIGGSGAPNTGAMLELEASNKGFLPPRINLTSLTMALNGITPADGMMIYSTNTTTGTGVGLYVWYNGRWNRMIEKIKNSTNARFTALNATATNGIQWDPVYINQPSELAPMYYAADPAQIWIRTEGLYLISASFRQIIVSTSSITIGSITISINGIASGKAEFYNKNTDVMSPTYTGLHYLQAGDYIRIISDPVGTPLNDGGTQLAITQIPLTTF